MKLLIKLFFVSGLMFVLALAAVVITLVYIDPNDYKGSIANTIKEETGRDIRIDGDISLSYYPWLGLDVEGINVGNASGFGDKPFLQTKTIKARVKLLPILRKELEMDTLVLHGTTLNLAKNEKGITNWDDLIKPKDETDASSKAMPLAALVLGGIDIKDASVYWDDKQQGIEYKITGANISTGELKFGEPIDLAASLNVSASKPALSAAVQFTGTVAYEDNGDVLALKPMLLEANVKGKEIPGGEALVKLSSEININLNDNTAKIDALDLIAFDTQVKGQISASKILSGKPEVNGIIDIKGKDLHQLLKIAEIEPLANQLAKMSDKTFDINTSFNADMSRNDIDVSKLDINLFGNKVNAEIYARNVGSESPAAKGKIKANGSDLPTLIKIASQFMGDGNQDLKTLSKQLSSAPKKFNIKTDFDIDLKSGTVSIPGLSINALGMTASGTINGKQINSDTPAINGELKTSGKDLPLLVSILAQLKGLGKKEIASLSSQLTSVPKTFSIETKFNTDTKSNTISIPALSVKALGMTANGNLKAKSNKSGSSAFSGELKATGPNLPLIMQIVGRMQTGDSQLPKLASDLGSIKNKAFNIETRFNTDLASGKIDLPSLKFNALGLNLNGNVKGNNIHKSNGDMEGKLTAISKDPKALLTALGHGDVAQVIKSININTGIKGNTSNLSLKPLSLEAVFSGKHIPNSPVKLIVKADSEINLEKEIFNLSGLQVKGLGLDLKGSVKATQFKTEPSISGNLAVAPFDLRQFMQSLNKDVPKTADANVLKRVAVATSFTGTGSSLSLKDLKAELDETKLQGNINLKRLSPLDIEFGLGVDKLNADRYLPPQTKAKPVTPEAAAVGVATGLPVETLQAIKIKGDFVMGSLVISNAKLSDMELSIRADKGDIKLAPAKAKLYQGTYSGDIHLNATGKMPKLTMNTNLKGVQAEPLLNDVVGSASAKGSANITLALASSGADINTLRSTLSGNGNILFEKGTLIGVDVKNVLHQVEIMIETKNFGTPDAGEKTEFDKLTASLNIHNGIIDNNDLLMLGSGFNVTGKGMLLNLNDETWKYTLIAKADATRVKQGEKTFNIGGHPVPIKCKGKIADKSCKPDVEAIAGTIVKKAVLDKVFEGIGGKKESVPSGGTTEEPAKNVQDKVIKDIFDKIF
jgi:uncharacterized protein involved in outer membrane biogenesis